MSSVDSGRFCACARPGRRTSARAKRATAYFIEAAPKQKGDQETRRILCDFPCSHDPLRGTRECRWDELPVLVHNGVEDILTGTDDLGRQERQWRVVQVHLRKQIVLVGLDVEDSGRELAARMRL